tara:strand:- start:388 stop:846 length:459 start_codon:yes stop_codon:yes gene_type:complete
MNLLNGGNRTSTRDDKELETKEMKIPLLIPIIILLLKTITSAETVDFTIEVTEKFIRSSETIHILGSNRSVASAQEVWYLLGACPNSRPNLIIKIEESSFKVGVKNIMIARPVMEPSLKLSTSLLHKETKNVCITNANDLDKETQKKLKLRR